MIYLFFGGGSTYYGLPVLNSRSRRGRFFRPRPVSSVGWEQSAPTCSGILDYFKFVPAAGDIVETLILGHFSCVPLLALKSKQFALTSGVPGVPWSATGDVHSARSALITKMTPAALRARFS